MEKVKGYNIYWEPAVLEILADFITTINLWGQWCYSDFTAEETESHGY